MERHDGTCETGPPVLVVGAGFAGLASAFWLHRLGYRVTIVERADSLRRGGTPVDVTGETIAILDRMRLLDAVRSKALPPRTIAVVATDGWPLASFGAEDDAADEERLEVHRDDLLDILTKALDDTVELRFGRTVVRLDDVAGGITAAFDDGSRGDFAFVVGCDGAGSRVRQLVFDEPHGGEHFLGGYFYLKVVRQTGFVPADRTELFTVDGRTAMINGYADRTDLCLAFRTDRKLTGDVSPRRLLRAMFDDMVWKVPAILKQVDADENGYFDALRQVRLSRWSHGRVVLVGDAGYCLSPLAGMGGSMAIIGAARLAEALRLAADDHSEAFRAYEAGLRSFVDDAQAQAATVGMAMMFPAAAAT